MTHKEQALLKAAPRIVELLKILLPIAEYLEEVSQGMTVEPDNTEDKEISRLSTKVLRYTMGKLPSEMREIIREIEATEYPA